MINRPVIRMHQPLGVFYAFSIEARKLLPLTRSLPAQIREDPDADITTTYVPTGNQRLEKPDRLEEIARFIQSSEATFPNAVILAANYDEEGNLVTDEARKWRVEEDDHGNLKLVIPNEAAPASIIDGQHRLHAFKLLQEDAPNADMDLLCSVFLDLPTPYHAYVFATINFNQVKVPRSTAYQLFGFEVEQKPPKFWVPETAAVSMARLLSTDPVSPFKGGVISGLSKRKEDDLAEGSYTAVSLSTVVDGILRLISKNPKHDRDTMRYVNNPHGRDVLKPEPGVPLRSFYLQQNDRAIYDTVRDYFDAVRDILWSNVGEDSYFRKTVGIQAEFDVLRKLLQQLPLTKNNLSKEGFLDRLTGLQRLVEAQENYQASGIGRTQMRRDIEKAIGIGPPDGEAQEEQLARELLAVMLESRQEPGTGMPVQSLLTKFGWERLDEFKVALPGAIQRGWLVDTDGFITLGNKRPG